MSVARMKKLVHAGPADLGTTGMGTEARARKAAPHDQQPEGLNGPAAGRMDLAAAPRVQAALHATKEPGPNGRAASAQKAARSDQMVIAR